MAGCCRFGFALDLRLLGPRVHAALSYIPIAAFAALAADMLAFTLTRLL
ncbi:MAG TPA: hypothetical protein VMM78_07320 [Thermomicrobiales bacterium]|nr:hypothetical protein [Thermomicrobiales bacterium]